MDKYGFPRGYCMRTKSVRGFETGDIVRADVPNGKKAGVHIGRVAVRARGSFKVGVVDDINWKHCRMLHRADGYGYGQRVHSPARLKPAVPCAPILWI